MRTIYLFILSSFFITSTASAQMMESRALIAKSIEYHDPQNKWAGSKLEVHIQEPRIGNPYRYSILRMDNGAGRFEMSRNRGERISTHIINGDGSSTAVLDGEPMVDSELIQQFRLGSDMNNIYKNSYDMMFGLPMSLSGQNIEEYGDAEQAVFNDKETYKVAVVLKEAVFSSYWNIFLSRENYQILGLEIYFPGEPEKGERLYFEGEYEFAGIKIPRIRHWHEFSNDDYSGTDIIVRALESENQQR